MMESTRALGDKIASLSPNEAIALRSYMEEAHGIIPGWLEWMTATPRGPSLMRFEHSSLYMRLSREFVVGAPFA